MATKNTLNNIKKDIEKYLGKKVVLKANKGRKKIVVKEGVVENIYPSVFVVKLDDRYNNTTRISYSYSDVLTSTVKLELFSPSNNIGVS
ncbi:MAG: Veg family protein [Peptostreptococcaceae bacterium]|nr:Veg family protein [Peptostreptococcaceae bacterium]